MQKLNDSVKEYENYRWFFTSSGVLVVGGKSDEQNESVINRFLKPNFIVMHTALPGSPFMIMISEKPNKKDIEECAIFCGCFSKQWKNGNKNIDIDIFKGLQVYKIKSMKTGTFGVKGDKKKIKINPELVLIIQKGKLRAVPKSTKEQKLALIKPGKSTKELASEKISKIIKDKFHFPLSKEEIMKAIPSNNLEVKEIK